MISALNPLKHLTGKLNHFRLQKPQVNKVFQIINIARNNNLSSQSGSTSLDSISLDNLKKLQSSGNNTQEINKKDYYKMRLALDVFSNPKYPIPTTTIYQPLPQSQKQLINTVTNFVSSLNSRQTLYLNYRIRSLINGQYVNWNKLHLHPEAPYRRDLTQLPLLSKAAIRQEVRTSNRKKVISTVNHINQELNKKKNASSSTSKK